MGSRFTVGFDHWFLGTTNPLKCTPKGVTIEQMRKVFLKWSENHPEKLHEGAMSGIDQATKEAFPCPKAPQR